MKKDYDIDLILKLYKEGVKAKDIAVRVSLSESYIKTLCVRNRAKIGYQKPPILDRINTYNYVIEMYKKRYSHKEISILSKIKLTSVNAIVSKHKLRGVIIKRENPNIEENHNVAKLNKGDVKMILLSRTEGESIISLSQKFKVTPEMIGKILRGQAWIKTTQKFSEWWNPENSQKTKNGNI